MNAKVTLEDFAAAKKVAKKVMRDGGCTSAAHRKAMDTLATRCPRASETLVNDMAWQCVLAAR